MSATHGLVCALVLSGVFSLLPSQGTLAVHCDKNILCINGKCVTDFSDEKKLPRCECDTLWFGASCSEFICDHHEANPCRNGAKCQPLDKYTDYQCLCDNSYSGKHCEVSNFNCTSTSCRKRGKCSDDSSRLSGYRCDCDTGFTGADCETNIDDCEGVNCNNGSCVDGIDDYTCKCFTNYTGRHCDHSDYCAIHSAEESHGCINGVCCANNGTCYNNLTTGRHECNCTPGWVPIFSCRRQILPCIGDFCHNGGTCEPNGIDYICHCVPPFTGPNCATQLTNCTDNTCLNNGTCIAEVTSELVVIREYCECPPYYTGELCQTHFDPCANKCQNNGTCESSYIGDGEYSTICSCTERFAGENCTEDINECSISNPCQNDATCINLHGSFNCVCYDGFTGQRCEKNIDDCVDVMCLNNGTCEDLINDFVCSCAPDYSGKFCQWHHSQTCNGALRPCVLAHTVRCIDDYEGFGTYKNGVGFQCLCIDGFIGDQCEAKILQCQNVSVCGGPKRRLNCIEGYGVNQYRCNCKFGYAGDRCEIDVDLCENSPCHNGGTCEDHGNNFTCQCPPGYSGHDCSCSSNTSDLAVQCTNMCINGDCISASDNQQYICQCHTNWYSDNCTVFICDHAEEDPCGRNGDCYQVNYTSYGCSCDHQYSGDHCQNTHFNCTNISCNGHGSCSDNAQLSSGYQCECDIGFTGTLCETNIDDCEGVNCNNGSCVDGIDDYTCNCFTNYTGRHCDHPDYCAIHSAEQSHGCTNGVCCKNNGTCYNNLTTGRHECNCTPGWLSIFSCRRPVDPCYGHLCQNGGTCVANGFDYICHCIPPYVGRNCETTICKNLCPDNSTCSSKLTGHGEIQEHCQCSPVVVCPKNATIEIGRNVTIICKTSFLGTFVYTWERFRTHNKIWTVVSNQNSTSYTASSFGHYRCKAHNGPKVIVSDAAVVMVQPQDSLVITDHPKSVLLKRKQFLVLTCNASGPGTLVYSWEGKPEGKWTTISRYGTSYNTSAEGRYRCRVTNEAESVVSTVAYIRYYKPPEIRYHPMSKLVGFNKSVYFWCMALGTRPLLYQWETRGSDEHPWMVIKDSSGQNPLKLNAVQSSSQVRCKVSNDVGTVVSNPATVTVFSITFHPQSTEVLKNSNVSFKCTSSVSSNVNFSWTRNGRRLKYNDRRVSTSAGGTSILTITRVKNRDVGEYKCKASSGSLIVVSTTANLTVKKP